MRTVLITLIGPERTADLVVDADTPTGDLLPSLLTAGGVGETERGQPGWGIALMGNQPIDRALTLEASGVLDGAVLVLRRDVEAEREPVLSPSSGTAPSGSPLRRTQALLERAGSGDGLEETVRSTPLRRCVTIAVLSPKGGIGKTTVSILLGELLRSLRSDQVLALDADSDYGSLGRIGPGVSAGDPVSARDTGIFDALAKGAVTFAELDRTLWTLPGGLRVVPSPRDPVAMARADREMYSRVIGNLQRLAGVLVIDCGTGLGQPGAQAAILASDQLVVLTDASGATASLAVESMRLLERAGRPITVVCNRLRRGKPGSDDLLRMDALFPRANALVGIPEDPDAERALRGEFAWPDAPRPLYQAVLELAAVLAGMWPQLGV
ncbi:MAG TPA: EsaB/YukD family protein [Solirubrobacteraceae bacterium]|nr:EsaB/YukD family protein [Solirubrobacteraceae bacterium]